MPVNPDFSTLNQAFGLKSALQEVSSRNAGYSGRGKAGLGSAGLLTAKKTPAITSVGPNGKLRMPVYSETGVRLIFSIFSRILEPWNWPQTPLVYMLGMGLILFIAGLVITIIWARALSTG